MEDRNKWKAKQFISDCVTKHNKLLQICEAIRLKNQFRRQKKIKDELNMSKL